MANDKSSGSVAGAAILGMMVGGAIGAVIGLLFAPTSGRDTRRRIRDASTDLRDRTSDFIDESRDRLREFVDESRDRINEFVEEGREEIGEAVSGIRGVVEEGRRAYVDRRRELAAEVDEASDAESTPPAPPQAAPSDESAAS